jgi:branched-subunit amino acid aminotransferase/4-amino-4-deoxychorismate lyase
VKDGVIYTSSDECDLLPGITRGIILKLIEELGIPFEIGKFDPTSFYGADSAFCTNSLIEIRVVKSIDDIEFKLGHKLIGAILDSFLKFKNEAL